MAIAGDDIHIYKALLTDVDAVNNAIELPWSNGQAEGQIKHAGSEELRACSAIHRTLDHLQAVEAHREAPRLGECGRSLLQGINLSCLSRRQLFGSRSVNVCRSHFSCAHR